MLNRNLDIAKTKYLKGCIFQFVSRKTDANATNHKVELSFETLSKMALEYLK